MQIRRPNYWDTGGFVMSYYQLVSLKLRMGIDPDVPIDQKTLLEMWKKYQCGTLTVIEPAILPIQRPKRKARVHYLP